MLHGLCGYDAKISFSEDTGSGFEYIGDKIQRNRPIYSIKIIAQPSVRITM